MESRIRQYSLGWILSIWAAATLPMALCGWVLGPALARDPAKPGFERMAVLLVGLFWQFILVLILVRKEQGNLGWAALRSSLWLGRPRSPKTGKPESRHLWWILPLLAITAAFGIKLSGLVDGLWISIFPGLKEPAGFALGGVLASPEGKAAMLGNWGVLALYALTAVFNTFIGEELLFRGLLLPRMRGVFKGWDWVANGILFGLYHLHQPWGILSGAISGAFLFAYPSRRFECSWFGIALHSGQSLFFIFLILGLVLGLA